MRSRCIIPALLIVMGLCGRACVAYNAGDPEFRALFVDAWHAGYLNDSQINQLISDAQYVNANAIIMEVRRRGDAFYSSSYEPWAYTVGFDSLAKVIQKAHAASPRIEVHAWFVVWPIASGSNPPADPNHPYNKYPQYLTKDESGNTLCSGDYWFDPGHPGAEQYTYNVIMDVVNRYDIDGINLDYIRFGGSHFGYNDVSVARFNAANGRTGQPYYTDSAWCNWRRAQVANFVRKVYANAIAVKPNIKITADLICGHPAPGVFSSCQAYGSYFQNWPAWMQEGILDMGMPMAYFECDGSYASDYYGWLCFTRSNMYNRQAAMIPGVYSASCLVEQINAARNYSCSGSPPALAGAGVYSYNGIVSSGLLSTLRSLWTSPVSPPAMTWKTAPTKGHIKGNVTYGGGAWVDGATITLTGPANRTTTADGTGFYAFIDLPPGSYSLTCDATNYGSQSGGCSVTAGQMSTVDFDYPASSVNITNIAVTNETSSGATIVWTTDAPATSKVLYGTDRTCSLSTVEDTALVTSHSVTLTGLSPLTPYYYRVYSKNPAAPVAISPVYALVTGPAQPVIIVDNADAGASFSGTWSTSSSSSAWNSTYRVSYLSGVQNATYTPEIPMSGNYNVYEWHVSGSNRCTVVPFTVTYNGGSQTYSVDETTGGSAWNLLCTKPFAAGTAGSVRISNQGASGGSAVIADAIKFAWVTETTPPSTPTGLTAASVGEDFVNLTWTPSTDNVAVAGYRLLKGGMVIDASPTNSALDTDVAPNTRYTYQVSAYDTSGNKSAASANYSVWTLPLRPTLSTIVPNKAAGVWHTSGPFVFTAVNGWGVGKVFVYRYAWDTETTHVWTGSETSWSRDTISCAATSSANPYYLHIRGYNQDGRPGDPADLGPFYVDSTGPDAPVVTDGGAYTTVRNRASASWIANDPESGVVAYKIAVGNTPGSDNLLAWTDWPTTDATVVIPTQSYGATVYVSVKAQNAAGLWGSVGTSDGIRIAKPITSVVQAKGQTDGTVMRITGRIVSAVYSNCFYVQDPAVASGIRCEGVCPYPVGTKVDVGGELSTTSAGERTLLNAEAVLSP